MKFRMLSVLMAACAAIDLIAAAVFPMDAQFTSQRYHWVEGYPSGSPGQVGLLQTPYAWEITTGSTNVRVAIISTGIDPRLLELSGRLVPGFNILDRNTNTMDTGDNGTAMATLLGANANNPDPRKTLSNRALGIAGIDWQCKIMPIRVQERGYTPMREPPIADAIEFATTNGCKVIVIGVSEGVSGSQYAPTRISTAISNAVNRGAIVVVSAGNSWSDISSSAAKNSLAITVGAAEFTGLPPSLGFKKYDSSNTGAELDIVASGLAHCITSWEGNPEFGYSDTCRGTRYAAAMVGGVCSLMAAVRPNITAREAYQLLAAGAWDRTMTNNPTWNPELGWGLINAYNSVLLAALNVDSVKKLNSNRIELSWRSPPDAERRAYFQVDFRPDFMTAWTPAVGSFSYTTNRTTWIGDYSDGFYRVGINTPHISFGKD